jgi:hypothetical protein
MDQKNANNLKEQKVKEKEEKKSRKVELHKLPKLNEQLKGNQLRRMM